MKTLTSPHVLCHKKIKQAMKTLSSPHVLCDKKIKLVIETLTNTCVHMWYVIKIKDKASHKDTITHVLCHTR